MWQPVGIGVLRRVVPRQDPATRLRRYRLFVLVATFTAYLCYHMTRRPIAVVKAVLNHNGSCFDQPPHVNVTVTTRTASTWCDWAPFTGDTPYLGYLDSIYLVSYAVCMFFSGFVAERMNLRYFLALGMALSGLTTYAFGLGHTFNVHTFAFYAVVQLVAGGVQSSGWPAVVTLMTNWFGKSKRGLMFGVWNAHTSVGNIVGALIAGVFVKTDWALSFYVPGVICAAVGVLVVLFLPATPREVGIELPHRVIRRRKVSYVPGLGETAGVASGTGTVVAASASGVAAGAAGGLSSGAARASSRRDEASASEPELDAEASLRTVPGSAGGSENTDSANERTRLLDAVSPVGRDVLDRRRVDSHHSAHNGQRPASRTSNERRRHVQDAPGSISDDDDDNNDNDDNGGDAINKDRQHLYPYRHRTRRDPHKQDAISFLRALTIPGVVEFSMALFFAKLVSYTFLFWLPLYVNSSTKYGPRMSATLSTVFDVGGIAGGILAGWLSDRSGASATTSVVFLTLSIPVLFIYRNYGAVDLATNIVLLTVTGFLVNGPYALITTAVSAELGHHPSVGANSKAMATVTAIIDGTGSVGAALGPLLADLLKNVGSNWLGVFLMVMLSDLLAIICLLRITVNELSRMRRSINIAHHQPSHTN